jgi:hypothetical protein
MDQVEALIIYVLKLPWHLIATILAIGLLTMWTPYDHVISAA